MLGGNLVLYTVQQKLATLPANKTALDYCASEAVWQPKQTLKEAKTGCDTPKRRQIALSHAPINQAMQRSLLMRERQTKEE